MDRVKKYVVNWSNYFLKIYAQTRNIVASDIKERALDSLFLWGAVSSSIKTETKTKIFTEQLFGHMPET